MSRYSNKSDQDLAARLRHGSREAEKAFGELYKRHANGVMAYCVCVVGSKEQAEDIFQETFLRFYNKAVEEESIQNVRGFLFTIARNLCLNAKRDRKKTVPIEHMGDILQAQDKYETKELLGLITMALELLEFKYREAFVMRKIDGLSLKEIARICDITVDGAKSRVNRARLQIIDILQPYLRDLCK